MADTKQKKIRIYKLATEHNLSAESLVEFLKDKGFKVKKFAIKDGTFYPIQVNHHYIHYQLLLYWLLQVIFRSQCCSLLDLENGSKLDCRRQVLSYS